MKPEYEFSFPAWMGPMPRVSSPWTGAEEKELVRLYRGGWSLADLARRHGRAEGGINSRLFTLLGENFYQRPISVVEFERLRDEVRTLAVKIDRAIGAVIRP